MSGLKKTLRRVAGAFSFRKRTCSQTGSSSWAGSDLDMSSVPRSLSTSQPEHHVLLQEHHIKLRTTSVTEVELAWGRTLSDRKFFLPVLLLVLILLLLLYLKKWGI
jgi:hypothetical protein